MQLDQPLYDGQAQTRARVGARDVVLAAAEAVALVNSGSFRGVSEMKMTMNGQTADRKSTTTGTRLSADCGHIKPGEPE